MSRKWTMIEMEQQRRKFLGNKNPKKLDLPESEICEEYLMNKSSGEMGNIYNCSGDTIINILKRNNIKIRDPGFLKLDLPEQEICEKYLMNFSSTILGGKFGCHSDTIINILKRNNIKIRSLVEDGKLEWEDPKFHERMSAIHQDQDYDNGEWTGFYDKDCPHLSHEQDCIKLNQPLIEGSEKHHLLPNVMLYTPQYLHNVRYGGIRHRMPREGREGYGMLTVNNVAFRFLMEGI